MNAPALTPAAEDARLDARKAQATAWFRGLRDQIVAEIEALEVACKGPFAADDASPGRFVITPWARRDAAGEPGGGGEMAMLKGRVFEKMGVHVSTVHGRFSEEFAKQIPGADVDPTFWASGISRHRAPLEPERADRAHEHPLRRDLKSLVRRRRRPDAGAGPAAHADRPRHHRLSRGDARGLRRACRRRLVRQIQSVVRRLFLLETPQRAARRRRHLFRLSQQRRRCRQFRLGCGFRLRARSRHAVPQRLSRRSCGRITKSLGPKRTATSSSCGAGAMSSSICSTTAARSSA